MTSPDGITWTARTAAQAKRWPSVTYGNGLFVAVSSTGTNRVMTSPDGITWTARTAAAANVWTSVTYGNGMFVAVANDWHQPGHDQPRRHHLDRPHRCPGQQWVSVTYGNGLFVAVAQTGTNRVMTSPDGITWTAQTAAAANFWYAVVYGKGTFVATSDAATNSVMTSPSAGAALQVNGTSYLGDLQAGNITTKTLTVAAGATFGDIRVNGNSVTIGTVQADGGLIAPSLQRNTAGQLLLGTTSTTTSLQIGSSNSTANTLISSGMTSVQSSTNNTTAFQVQSNGGTNILMNADTLSGTGRVSFGTASNVDARVYIDGGSGGVTWTARTAAQANSWNGVTYGNGTIRRCLRRRYQPCPDQPRRYHLDRPHRWCSQPMEGCNIRQRPVRRSRSYRWCRSSRCHPGRYHLDRPYRRCS